MAHDTSSTKVAVLTGLTMLLGGAEISSVQAATILQHQTFGPIKENDPTLNLTYNFFDASLGTLTGAKWELNSIVFGTFIPTTVTNFTASFNTVGLSISTSGPTSDSGNPFIATSTFFGPGLSQFIGVGTFLAGFTLTADCGEACNGEGWSGSFDLTYTYDPADQNVVPLPAALPLFATGAAGLGLLGWRKRRQQKAKEKEQI